MQKTKKYMSDIHLEGYTEEYESIRAGYETSLFSTNRPSESLCGLWHYAVDQYDTFLRQKWYLEKAYDENGYSLPVDYSFDEWPIMELPVCWNTVDDKYLLYEGSMVFTRTFSYDSTDDENVYLRVGAANYLIRVFINGQYAGIHRGGSTPAFFDITEFLKDENRIIIQADSTRRPEQVPTENTDWFNYGGIYREIELIHVPKIHIKDFRTALVPDGTFLLKIP